MREKLDTFIEETLPEFDPVIFAEKTDYGWRGLTGQGEVLEVHGANGHQIEIPESMIVQHRGTAVGRRAVKQ